MTLDDDGSRMLNLNQISSNEKKIKRKMNIKENLSMNVNN